MNVGWTVVEEGNVGSDQLLHGPEGLDGLGGLDVTTAELPGYPQSRPSVLADDRRRGVDERVGTISVNFETDDVPFQQPSPRTAPVEAGRNRRSAIVDAGRWPIVALGVAAVLAAVFVLFISRNGQSTRGDGEPAQPPSVVESATAALASDGLSGRSTGELGPADGSGFFTGQIIEPDRSLTGDDVDWMPTTTAAPTTEPPTTATTVTTPVTEETSTTTTPETTATTVVPGGLSVRAIGPGSTDETNPAVVSGNRVTLEAEGSEDGMRYRFVLSVRDDDGDWRQIDRSGWRSRSNWTVKIKRLEGLTVRWTVVGADRSRNRTDESAPLYFRVGEG